MNGLVTNIRLGTVPYLAQEDFKKYSKQEETQHSLLHWFAFLEVLQQIIKSETGLILVLGLIAEVSIV